MNCKDVASTLISELNKHLCNRRPLPRDALALPARSRAGHQVRLLRLMYTQGPESAEGGFGDSGLRGS